MTVTLTPDAEALLRVELLRNPQETPEQVLERALRMLPIAPEASTVEHWKRKTPAEAVARILELRKGATLGGLKIKDLINEGRKY